MVLHEISHAIRKHKSPQYDSLNDQEFEAQEQEADAMALQWFNDHIATLKNPYLAGITHEEIERAKARSQKMMKGLLNGT